MCKNKRNQIFAYDDTEEPSAAGDLDRCCIEAVDKHINTGHIIRVVKPR